MKKPLNFCPILARENIRANDLDEGIDICKNCKAPRCIYDIIDELEALWREKREIIKILKGQIKEVQI